MASFAFDFDSETAEHWEHKGGAHVGYKAEHHLLAKMEQEDQQSSTQSTPTQEESTIITIPVHAPQMPAISLSGNNAQRTLWIGDVPSEWTEETLNQVFTESNHAPYKVKRVYVKDELKGYCFIEFLSFEEAQIRFNLCFANDSYNPNSEFNLHVSNVPHDMSDAELYRVFDKYYSCRGAKMFRFVDGSSKGTGYIRFGNQTDQQMALVEMHRTRVGSGRIIIKLAGPRGERLDRGEGGGYKPRGERRREEKSSLYRNGTAVPQQTQMFDAFGNPVIVAVDKNIYGTDHPWGPFPDDPELDPIIGLDLLTTKYRPQISNKRVMIDTDQFFLDLDSSRWSPIVLKTNIKNDEVKAIIAHSPRLLSCAQPALFESNSEMSSFMLMSLPYLPFKKIFEEMENREKVHLALTSTQVAKRIKALKLKVERYIFRPPEKKYEPISPLNFLLDVFPTKSIAWGVHWDKLKPGNLERLLSDPLFTHSDYVDIGGSKPIPSDVLNHLIDNLSQQTSLQIQNVAYLNARWVEEKDLLTIRDSENIILGDTVLDNASIKTFISYWSNSKYDVVRNISIVMKETTDVSRLLGVVVCVWKRKFYFLQSRRRSEHKKYTYASVRLKNNIFHFQAYSSKEMMEANPLMMRVVQMSYRHMDVLLTMRKVSAAETECRRRIRVAGAERNARVLAARRGNLRMILSRKSELEEEDNQIRAQFYRDNVRLHI
ncbi:unnamed protein product [Caenorhabditis sp. 36 PRJEB53466]|nr:unnamed protein product [Caenorhabditis sp. 36 PRJEB53466]